MAHEQDIQLKVWGHSRSAHCDSSGGGFAQMRHQKVL